MLSAAALLDLDDRRTWARDVNAVLAELPPQQAGALRLLYFEHVSDHEMAVRMGIAIKQARMAAADGLCALGRELQRRSGRTDQ